MNLIIEIISSANLSLDQKNHHRLFLGHTISYMVNFAFKIIYFILVDYNF